MRERLLALSGFRADGLGPLSPDEWHQLDKLADGHRLRPHLHGRLSRGELAAGVPQQIADKWREAHRDNAIAALLQRRALVQADALLRQHSVELVALKGSALAWSIWPAPAERVMRDIDILVSLDSAATVYELLRESGWQAPAMTRQAIAAMAQNETHLPPLFSPEGVMCELHAHAWSSAPLAGISMPHCDDAGILRRSRKDQELGIRVPPPEDMLAHLVVHCASSHLFNVGPLALADIDYLVAAETIDWGAFWRVACENQFDRPAGLVLTLVNKWRRPGLIEASGLPIEVDSTVLAQAEQLLVQDPAARKDINALAGLALGDAANRLQQHPLDAAEEPQGKAARLKSLAGRGVSLAGSMLNKQTRKDAAATANVANWMSGG